MEKEYINIIQLITFYTITILIYFFIKLLCEGKLMKIYPENKFNYTEYIEIWKNTTNINNSRYIFSKSYYDFLTSLETNLTIIKEKKINSNINITIKTIKNETFESSTSKINNIAYILVSLIPVNNQNLNNRRLLISAHFDTHNNIIGAYDDQINIIAMVGTISALLNNNYTINSQVDFFFNGIGEIDLIGFQTFIKGISKEKNFEYDYLNLEGMGSSTPYIFSLKNYDGSSNVIKSLSKTKGSILLPLNFFYNSNIIKLNSNHIIFNKQNWKGGVNCFLGMTSHYHTKYDTINKEYHLEIIGHQLLGFVLNYKPFNLKGNDNVFSFGISPICLVFSSLTLYIFIPLFFIIIIVIIYFKEDETMKNSLFEIFKCLIMTIIIFGFFLLESFISYKSNSCSFASNQFFLVLISFSGLCIFYISLLIFKIKKFDLFRLIIDSLIMLIGITTDFSIPFSLCTLFSLLFYLFNQIYLRYIFGILRIFITSFYYSNLMQLIMQYTTFQKGYKADLFLYISFFLFSFHCSIPGISIIINDKELNEIEEIEKLNTIPELEGSKDELFLESIDNYKSENEKDFLFLFFTKFIFIIPPIIIVLIIIFKQYPYSEYYTIRGQFMQVFEENEIESKFFFFPHKDIDYLKKSINNNNIIYQKYSLPFNFNNKGYSLKKKDNSFKCIINDTNVTNFSNSTNEIKLKFSNINPICINSIYVVVICDKCVMEGNGKNFSYENNNNYIMSLRIGKKEKENFNKYREIETNIKLNHSKPYEIKIIYNSPYISEEYEKFKNSFKNYSVNAYYNNIINDVLYIHNLKKN